MGLNNKCNVLYGSRDIPATVCVFIGFDNDFGLPMHLIRC